MSLCLAATWDPRGELPRLMRLLPDLLALYDHLVIVLPPFAGEPALEGLQALISASAGRLAAHLAPDWRDGRRLSLQFALDTPVDCIQYADLDRLLRWLEMRPDELSHAAQAVCRWDCLVIGRDARAYATHPQALVQTEAISNLVGSYFLGHPVDLSAGSKGFSRRAVEFLMAQAGSGSPFGADAEWVILLKRAGFRLGFLSVEGLDWESADRYQEQAATPDRQQQAAAAYDSDPAHWSYRTQVALEIVQSAVQAARRSLPPTETADFNFEALFDVDDYMYFYQDMLPPEVSDRQVEFLRRELRLQPPVEVLDLACGFGRHANRLAALGCQVTGIDLTPGFLEIARREAQALGLQVDYRQGDMRCMDYDEQFDRVLLLFTAFGYFDDAENLHVLQNMARALKPGGLLVIDINHRDNLLKRLLPSVVTEKEGNLMIDRSSFDSLTGRMTNRRIVIRDGLRRDKPFSVRLYTPTEIKSLLPLAGLTLAGIYGDWDSTPLSADSRRMIVIAKKSLPGENE